MVEEIKDISNKAPKKARRQARLFILHHTLYPLPVLMSYGKPAIEFPSSRALRQNDGLNHLSRGLLLRNNSIEPTKHNLITTRAPFPKILIEKANCLREIPSGDCRDRNDTYVLVFRFFSSRRFQPSITTKKNSITIGLELCSPPHFLLLAISANRPKTKLHAARSYTKFSQEYQTVGLPELADSSSSRQEMGRP
jgi:hypothetical protein